MLNEWQQELRDSLTCPNDLFENHLISSEEAQKLSALGEKFQTRITPYYAKLIENSPHCPIRQQAIPHLNEEDPTLPDWAIQQSQEIYRRPAPWHPDPIGDFRNLAAPRLTHRYSNRAILHLSSLCAVYCRFCFRKSQLNAFPDAPLAPQDDELDSDSLYTGSLDPALNYIKAHSEIRELILTGGDPLSVTETVLTRLFESLNQIEHLRVVRIHSRMAVTLPCRFTPALIDILARDWKFQVTLVSHFNHAKELTAQAQTALRALKKGGITLLNQSVLLKGINDSPECLVELFQGLYEMGVLPYYLHHPDWTPGTFHFRTSIERGKQLYSQIQGRVSGPALPTYILDIPSGYGKISLMDGAHQMIQKFESSTLAGTTSTSSRIQGALYELSPSLTRSHVKSRSHSRSHLYLDLYQENECP